MQKLKILTLLAGAFLWGNASAVVVCDSCDYQPGPSVASNLGLHNPNTGDNSTFSNATTGQNGDFANWWVFEVDPAGAASVNAIFLPLRNIVDFAVKLYKVDQSVCNANTASQAGSCSSVDVGVQVGNGNTTPSFATALDFTPTLAGTYAFSITGTILNLGATMPASYTGNLQVAAVPEPSTMLMAGLGVLGLGLFRRKLRG
jgi:hypothetical protein